MFHNREKLNENKRSWRKRRKELGLCIDCSNPIVLGYTRCANCLLKNALSYRQKRQQNPKWKELENIRRKEFYYMCLSSNRCCGCGAPLREDEARRCFACIANHLLPMVPKKKGVYREVNNQNLTRQSQLVSIR